MVGDSLVQNRTGYHPEFKPMKIGLHKMSHFVGTMLNNTQHVVISEEGEISGRARIGLQ